MNKKEEIDIKLDRVRRLLSERRLGAVLLSTTANFAWLTGGGDDHVELNNKGGVASILITPTQVHIITNNIESPRISNEEVTGLDFSIVTSAWYDPNGDAAVLAKLTRGLRCGADTPRQDMALVAAEVSELRYELTEAEIERYRWLGVHSTLAIEKAARDIEPGMTENQIAAEMARNLLADDMTPVVLLVATDERNFQYRHPIPTQKKLSRYAMLIACARRWGLVTSRTRSVYFGDQPQELADRQQAVCYVDGVFMAKTRTGTPIADIFRAAQRAYAEVGYPDEWQHHHQGGPIGYESRDYIGLPSSTECVAHRQAFTWNPTIQGTKSEDTFLSSDGAPEIITMTGDWPTIEVEVDGVRLSRPDILAR